MKGTAGGARRSRRAAIVAFLILGAAVVALRWPSVRVDILNEDEALYAATAAVMATGEPIYRAGVESKPPGIFYLYEAGFAVVGRYNMRGLHALTIPWVFAAGIFVGLIAGELTGRRRWWLGSPPFVAALFYYGFTIVQEPQVFATQCELVYTLPLAAAAWLILRACREATGWLALVGAGVLIGLGTLIKPTAVSLLLAGGAWLAFVRPFARGERFWLGVARAATLTFGFALAWLAAFVWFSHLGVWDDLVYWAFRWTLGKYIPTGTEELPWLARFAEHFLPWVALTITLWALAGRALVKAILGWRRETTSDSRDLGVLFVVGWALVACAMTCLGGRFYDHYFPAAIPPLAALAAAGWWRMKSVAWRCVAVALTIIPVAVCSFGGWTFATTMQILGDPRPAYLATADYVREHTRPDDRVFVWGYFPLIYVAADRLPASRFVGCHYLTGYAAIGLGRNLPPAMEDALGIPGGFPVLLAELEAAQPPIFVDTAPADLHHWARYPLSRYPALAAYVAAHYVREAEVQGSVIYRRRESEP